MTHLPEDSTSNVKVGIAILVLIPVIMQVVRFQYFKTILRESLQLDWHCFPLLSGS
jgi:hypothetical protein